MLKEWETGKAEVPDEVYNKIMEFPTEPLFKNKPIEKLVYLSFKRAKSISLIIFLI